MFQPLADLYRSNDIFVKIYVQCSVDGRLSMKEQYNALAFEQKRIIFI